MSRFCEEIVYKSKQQPKGMVDNRANSI